MFSLTTYVQYLLKEGRKGGREGWRWGGREKERGREGGRKLKKREIFKVIMVNIFKN